MEIKNEMPTAYKFHCGLGYIWRFCMVFEPRQSFGVGYS